jgi:hypothetical protein
MAKDARLGVLTEAIRSIKNVKLSSLEGGALISFGLVDLI